MHDVRSGNEPGDSAEQPQEEAKPERHSRADVEKWGHDLYNEQRQQPKSGREISHYYGYDIRSKEQNENEEEADGEGETSNKTAPKPARNRRFNPNFSSNRRRQFNQGGNRSTRRSHDDDDQQGDEEEKSDNRPPQRNNYNRQRGNSEF